MYERFQTALSVLFPPACLGCGGLVDRAFALCGSCWRETAFIGGVCCDKCGAPQHGARGVGDEVICDDCLDRPRNWTFGRAALLYTGNGRKMVLGLKHGDRHDIACMAGRWMVQAVSDLITSDTLLVPVPLHWTRLLGRTFNQSALLAREMSRHSGCQMIPDALIRTTRTVSLDHRLAEERQAVLHNSMTASVRGSKAMTNRPVIVVDDVMTSGATFFEATRACLDAGAATVSVVALARAAKSA